MKRIAAFTLLVGLVVQPNIAFAEEQMVAASDPEGLVEALQDAGYSPVLGKDDIGDPQIKVELSGYPVLIYFYGCSEETNDKCDSLQFSVGFDRAEPWTAAEAMEISNQYRFASVMLDDEGDPFVRWDVVTGSGIPTRVFLQGVLYFTQSTEDAGDLVFAAERQAK